MKLYSISLVLIFCIFSSFATEQVWDDDNFLATPGSANAASLPSFPNIAQRNDPFQMAGNMMDEFKPKFEENKRNTFEQQLDSAIPQLDRFAEINKQMENEETMRFRERLNQQSEEAQPHQTKIVTTVTHNANEAETNKALAEPEKGMAKEGAAPKPAVQETSVDPKRISKDDPPPPGGKLPALPAEDKKLTQGSHATKPQKPQGHHEGSIPEGEQSFTDDKGRKHIVTTTTTTVTRKLVGGNEGGDDGDDDDSEGGDDDNEESEESSEKSEESEESKEESEKEGSEDTSENAEEKKEGDEAPCSDPDNPDCQQENKELKMKKKQLHHLEKKMKSMEKKYQDEHNWLVKALHLISELHIKTSNVRLHLNDYHKQMVAENIQRRLVENDVKKLERQGMLNHRLKSLGREMHELLSHAERTKAEVVAMNAKRNEYLSRLDQVRSTLEEIKAEAIRNRATTFIPRVSPSVCDCSQPLTIRPVGCPCGQ